MHKVFHMLVPLDESTMNRSRAAEFHSAWDRHASALAGLANTSDGFRFYTRTDTLQNASDFRDAARNLGLSLFGESSAWLIAEEHLHANGAPRGPLDTGPGTHVITSMRRRQRMTLVEFRRPQEDHAQLVVSTQGISRYAVNLVVDAEYATDEPPVDAVIEVWFRMLEDMRACSSDPSMTGVQQVHNRLFVDTSTFFALQCRDAEQWVAGARAPVPGSVP